MTQQTAITLTGYVGGTPKMYDGNGKTPFCIFRVASTRRYYNKRSGQWEDMPTVWVSVKAFRDLALNVSKSISRGDPVIVTGQLTSSEWTDKDGNRRTTNYVEAQSIGHDLTRGIARFRRTQSDGGDEGVESQTGEIFDDIDNGDDDPRDYNDDYNGSDDRSAMSGARGGIGARDYGSGFGGGGRVFGRSTEPVEMAAAL